MSRDRVAAAEIVFRSRAAARRAARAPRALGRRGHARVPGADRAREPARQRDRDAAAGRRAARRSGRGRSAARGRRAAGALHGLPIAIKDLSLTRGLRTTFGSTLYRNFVPTSDELYVERVRRAGAIVIGKTNTPEFGAGSQTFNALFGATRNPYDLTKTCGGSSGGAAVALACGMLPLADGTDLGGSLRNPASFCNVVGFRPSPGRVPRLNARAGDTLGVHGPMARSVDDLALLLSVMAGPDARDPLSLPEPGARVSRRAASATSPARASPGASASAAIPSSPRSRRSATPRAPCSASSVATSSTASPISTASTSCSKRCARPATRPRSAATSTRGAR